MGSNGSGYIKDVIVTGSKNGIKPNNGWIGVDVNSYLSAYNSLANSLHRLLIRLYNSHCQVIALVGCHMACKRAQNFGGEIANSLNKSLEKIRDDFIRIINSVRSAGISWSNTTHSNLSLESKESLILEGIRPVKSYVSENYNGIRGVDVGYFESQDFKKEITNDVDGEAFSDSVKAVIYAANEIGFLDKNSVNALVNSINNICASHKLMLENMYNNIIVQCKKIAAEFGDTGDRIGREILGLAG